VLRLLALFCSRNLPDRRKRIVKNDTHLYEVRPRKDHRGHDLISDALPFGRLWYGEPDAVSNAIDYVKFFSRLHDAVIRVYDAARRTSRNALAARHCGAVSGQFH
jgi:hypothetical protein